MDMAIWPMEQLRVAAAREGGYYSLGGGAGPSVRLRERMNAIRREHGATHASVR
jgi:hypothetical protein